MRILEQIVRGVERGSNNYYEALKRLESEQACYFELPEFEASNADNLEKKRKNNILACGDNMAFMIELLRNGYRGALKCIYIDPPFFTKAKYNASISIKDSQGKKHSVHHLAYDDTFERNLEFYIENMTARLLLMRDLLSDDGLLWVHLDWHSSHYVKLILDEIMGEKNFVNEIIWKYKSGGSGKRHFSKKHDSILVYSKSKKYYLDVPKEKSYNRNLKPYNFKGVKEYRDEYGWYTLVNMKDVWTIDMVGRTSKERVGYATQKPLELMNRIVQASTREGDLCADFFCGSGSFVEAAEQLDRQWIGCDLEMMAMGMVRKRLDDAEYVYCRQSDENVYVKNDGISMEFVLEEKDELESGKSLYRYSLKSFVPNIDIGHIKLSERVGLQELMDADGRCFVDYIMIDTCYDGSFKPEILKKEDFDDIKFISRGDAAFIVVDVFGREYLYEL